MAVESKQVVNTLYQQYRRALEDKQKAFNLSDDQVHAVDVEVMLLTAMKQHFPTTQALIGNSEYVASLIMTISGEEYGSDNLNIEIEEVNIIL